MRERRLDAGMSGAAHDHIILFLLIYNYLCNVPPGLRRISTRRAEPDPSITFPMQKDANN
jgi:hypothetical protein